MKTYAMRNQELFNHMSREHGLALLESEMHEIELIVARTLANDRVQEAARSQEGSVRAQRVGRCVACGGEADGTYGKREEPDALPICGECYTSGRLRTWLDCQGGDAPTVEHTRGANNQ